MHLHDYLGWPGPATARQHEAWVAWVTAKEDREAGRSDPRAERAELAARRQERMSRPGVKVVTKTRTEIERDGPEAELRRRGAEEAAKRGKS